MRHVYEYQLQKFIFSALSLMCIQSIVVAYMGCEDGILLTTNCKSAHPSQMEQGAPSQTASIPQ